MNWKEAYNYMKSEGGKITRKSWLIDDYLYLENGVLMCDGGYEFLPLLKTTKGEWIKYVSDFVAGEHKTKAEAKKALKKLQINIALTRVVGAIRKNPVNYTQCFDALGFYWALFLISCLI